MFPHRHLPSPTASSRTILALHGTGGDENDLIPLAQAIDPHAAILSPRGRVDENGMNRFFRRIAEGVFDQQSLREETDALADFVRSSSADYGLSLSGLWAVGFSNGANIGASLLLRHPDLLAGGILIRAMTPFEPSPLPDLSGKRVLISSGRHDPILPLSDAQRLAEIFRQSGAEVEHVVLEAGHNLVREDVELARKRLS